MTTHGHTGVCACPVVTGQGVMGMAKAVSVGNQTLGPGPHPTEVAPAGIIEGIAEGAKNSIAAMSTVLTPLRTRLRIFICCPRVPVLTNERLIDSRTAEYQPFARTVPVAGCGWFGIGTQYSKPQVHASAVVSWRLFQKLAARAERTIDPAQPMTTHGHTGVCECPVGQGTGLIVPAKAVSVGNQAGRKVPQAARSLPVASGPTCFFRLSPASNFSRQTQSSPPCAAPAPGW